MTRLRDLDAGAGLQDPRQGRVLVQPVAGEEAAADLVPALEVGGGVAPEEERKLPGGVPGAVLLEPAGVGLEQQLDGPVELGRGDAAAGKGAMLVDNGVAPVVDPDTAELADPALQAEDPGELEHAGPGPAGEGHHLEPLPGGPHQGLGGGQGGGAPAVPEEV